MRLIDADALEKEGWIMSRHVQKDAHTMLYEMKKPGEFSTIEPERKKGEWIHEGLEASCLRCSSCGYRDYAEEYNKFCPNCGADMRQEEQHD